MPVTTRAASRRIRAASTQPAYKTAGPSTISKSRPPRTPSTGPTAAPSDESASKLQEWDALVAKRPPCKHLKLEDFPEFSKVAKPPRRIYGWMFDDSYMLALAARRGLSFKPGRHTRHLFGGRETFKYSDLTEEHFRNERLIQSLQRMATMDVLVHFSGRTGTCVEAQSVISPGRKSVVVVWTNYDMGPAYALFEGWREGGWNGVKKFLDDAMNECLPPGAERTELLWWWPVIQS